MPRAPDEGRCAPATTPGERALHWAGLLVPGFAEIARHRPVVAPLVLVAVLSAAAAFSIQPVAAWAASGETAGGLAVLFWVSGLLAPVVSGLKGLILGVLAWSVLVLAGRERGLRLLVSAFLYGEAVLALHGVAMVSVLHLRGPGGVTGPEDLYVPMGLEGLAPADAPVLQALARGATVFHGAWALFLVLALVRSARLSPSTAALVAAGAWALLLLVTALRAAAFS